MRRYPSAHRRGRDLLSPRTVRGQLKGEQAMAHVKYKQMTREAVTRIARDTAKKNDGQMPPKSFAGRADAVVQRREAQQRKQGS